MEARREICGRSPVGGRVVVLPADFHLLEGEQPLWYGRRSWKANWPLLLFFLLTFWVLGLGLLFLLWAYLRVRSTEYLLTNLRVYAKYGLIGRRVLEVRLDSITGSIVSQGLFGRVLNYGTVILSAPGHYAGSVVLADVADPMRVRALIEDARLRHRPPG